MSTAEDRREQARGHGVGQAGQFGHQQHSAPAAFDAGEATHSMADVPTPTVWASLTFCNERGTVVGYGDEERLNPDHTRQILDSWPIASVEELRDAPGEGADEELAQAFVERGFAKWPVGERGSVGATPDIAELTTYIAARKADEARRGADAARDERVAAAVEHASLQLARHADRYQTQVGATAASIALQLHPDAKEVLVGTNDMTGEYTLVGVRNHDGTVDTDWVDGDRRLESCLKEMPWEEPQWLTYIDEDAADADLRDEHGASHFLDISDVSLSTRTRLYELDNA